MDHILPAIGSRGYYSLAAPFDALAANNVEYTCQAIRRINDYLANNEDVKATVYTAQGLDDATYEQDALENAYIVSLQSRQGHWLYVPYRYVLAYPSTNGVQYRSVMVGVSLPPLPASQDLTAVLTDVKAMIDAGLGVNCAVRLVETSKVMLIPHDVHMQKKIQRTMLSQGKVTLYSQNVALREENAALQAKLAQLEAYIKEHYVTP